MRSAVDKGVRDNSGANAPLPEENGLNSAENAFFTNLLLLSFDAHKEEKKHGIPFHPQMFVTSNAKGMQAILHFLFHRLSSEQAKKAFKNCWPIIDQRSQGTEFKKQAFALLSQLEKDGRLPSNTVRLSHLQTCCGERFVHMLWHLSTLVLRKVMQRKYPHYHIPPIPALEQSQLQNAHVLLRAAKLHTIQQRRKFVALAQQVVATQQKWRQYAQDIENDYRRLTVELNEVKEERKKLDACINKQTFSKERLALREIKKKEVKRVWDLFAQHQQENVETRELINDIIDNRTNATRVDGADLQAKLAPFIRLISSPQFAKQLTSKELDDLRAVKLIVNDKVDLVALVKAWTLVISMLKKRALVDEKRFTEKGKENVAPFAELEALAPSLKEQLEIHRNHLMNVRNLNNQLQEDIPDIKDSINEYRKKLAPLIKPRDNTQQQSQHQPRTSSLTTPFASSFASKRSLVTPSKPQSFNSLQLVPPTPAVSFSPDFLADENDENVAAESPDRIGFNGSDTPVSEQQIMRSVRRAAKHIPIRPKDAIKASATPTSQTDKEASRDSSISKPTALDEDTALALNEFSPLHSMDFQELFSPLAIQKKSRLDAWVDFTNGKDDVGSEFTDLEYTEEANTQLAEKKRRPVVDEKPGDENVHEQQRQAKEENQGKPLEVLAKELVEDFFSDDIFAISGTNYTNEDAFADLLQAKKGGLFMQDREDMYTESLDNEFEDLESEKETRVQNDENCMESTRTMGEIDSDFSTLFEDTKTSGKPDNLESSVRKLRKEMKKEAQRRVSKCFDFDLEFDWEEEESKKPARMEDLEEDVMAELDAIEKLDSEELDLSEYEPSTLRTHEAVDGSTDVSARYDADFGDEHISAVEASPFTQLIMEERRRQSALADTYHIGQAESEGVKESHTEQEEEGTGMGEELVLSLSVDKHSDDEERKTFEESVFASSILKDDENDAADWDEFLLASVRNKRTRSVKENEDAEQDLLTPIVPHHLRLTGCSDPVTPSFLASSTPSVPRKLSFSSPESLADSLDI